MKNTVKWLGIIALTVIITIFLVSCDELTTEPETDTNQTPVADDFIVSNLTQTAGSVIAVTITPKEGKSSGAITIYYNGSTSIPMGVGTYNVTFDVAAITSWNAATGLIGGTLTINATNLNPVASDFDICNLTQTIGSVTAVTITPQTGKSNGAITIYYNGSQTLPTTAGSYAVTFDVAATIGFNAATGLIAGILTINATNQNPVASDFDIGNLTQTIGSITAVTITPQTGKSNGAITIYYNGSTTLPTTAGSYTITFDVAASTGWNAAAGLIGGTLTINAPNQTPVSSDFDIGNLTQTEGSVSAVTITPQTGKSSGTITIYYNGSTTLLTTAGTYAVTFDVAVSTGWNEVTGLIAGTLTITIPEGTVSFNIDLEQIIDLAPNINSGITLYLTNNDETRPLTATFTITNPENYNSISWRVQDTDVTGTGASFTLNADNPAYNQVFAPGQSCEHFVTVFVFINGIPYNKTVSFKIEY